MKNHRSYLKNEITNVMNDKEGFCFRKEFNGAFSKQDKESKARINKKVFDIIQKTIGKFEILV